MAPSIRAGSEARVIATGCGMDLWVLRGKARRRSARPVREGVSKGGDDGRRPPDLLAGHLPNSRKAVWGVSCLQGV
jgi:hypothetical protein